MYELRLCPEKLGVLAVRQVVNLSGGGRDAGQWKSVSSALKSTTDVKRDVTSDFRVPPLPGDISFQGRDRFLYSVRRA
jgi:hypothetical protein